MLKRLTHNWSLKSTALLISVVLWSHVRGQVNPWEMASFKVKLGVSLPRGYVLQEDSKLPVLVTVAVRGPRLTLRGLKGGTPANPLSGGDEATLLKTSQLRASLDFSAPRKGTQTVAVKAASTLEDVEVVGVKPAELALSLDVAQTRRLPVTVGFELPADFRATRVTPSTARVTVSGASRVLDRIAAVRPQITRKWSEPGEVEVAAAVLQAVDEDGEPLANVQLEPATVNVRARIEEAREEATVPVRPAASGRPATGFEIEALEVEPTGVLLRGPRRLLKNLTALPLEVPVDGARENFSRRLRVRAPAGVELVSPTRVRVRVRVRPLQSEIPDSLPTPSTPADGRLPTPAPASTPVL